MLGPTTPSRVLLLAGLAYAIVQTITFSLYLYSAETYPARLRALGTGLLLRRPDGRRLHHARFGIQYVLAVFAAVLVVGALVTALCAIETKGRVLRKSPRRRSKPADPEAPARGRQPPCRFPSQDRPRIGTVAQRRGRECPRAPVPNKDIFAASTRQAISHAAGAPAASHSPFER